MFDQINTRSVVFNIIAVNVILFVCSLAFPSLNEILSLHYIFNKHGYLPGSNFHPFQLVTHMFMHGGFAHILFNMFALFMFGNVLERVWGPKRFLTFYFVTGLGAVALHTLVQLIIVHNFTGTFDPTVEMLNDNPGVQLTYFSNTVGASGAIYGVLIGFAMLFPNTELIFLFFPVPVKAKYLVPLLILAEIYMGFAVNDNIAHFAHLGGALFGFILVKIWSRDRHSFY